MATLYEDLKRYIAGEVRFDPYTRALYSTDASIYEIEPLGVVIPRHAQDVVRAVQIANDHKAPILPRGGGTSLAGQTVGRAVVLDFSKYLHRVTETNTEEGWVRVEPGVVQDELNAYLRPLGFLFGPDTATSNRATLGGMIGNNSAGARSIVYGKTVDHVMEVAVVLSDGTEARFGLLGEGELAARQKLPGLEGQIYRAISTVVEKNREEITRRYPKLMRRVSGYNLDEFVKGETFNLAKLIVGSEGTLAVVTEAKVKILPQPKMRAVMVTHFHHLIEAMVATQEILPCGPSAVELLDKTILNLARGSLEYGRLCGFIQGEPEAILITEFYGESPQDLRQKLEYLEERLRREKFGYARVPALDPAEQANIWKVRKAGLGLLLSLKGEKKPIAFVEDTAVSPEKLPKYLQRFNQIIAKYDTSAGFYGHCSVGCLHIRPLINLKQPPEIKKMRAMAEEVCDLVLEFSGALSGEHGDGLARSMWNEKLFGPTLYNAFKEVKAAFDLQGLMNPGKIVEAPEMTENLRYGSYYRTREVQTHFSFAREGGLAAAVELCSGVGACRKKQDGTMCPSYMVTLEEEHSTRGRANALRMVLSGRLPAEALTSRRLQEVLDLCLECKGCKAECPAGVDMAKLKYEVLAHYYEEHGFPLRARLFANIETLNRLGCLVAPLSNWITAAPPLRWLLHRFCGIDKRRPFPPFARPTFPAWFQKRVPPADGSRGTVVLFNDTFMNYNYPEVGRAAVTLLEGAGFRVVLPDKKCCGRPMISKGMLARAKEHARYNVAQLAAHVEQGAVIVGCEPSCLLTLRDEYPDLIEDKRAELVAQNSYLIEEFLSLLAERGELGLSFRETSREVLFHGHCHQKALVGTRPSLQILRLIPGLQVREIDSGCCGMAGAFGYETEHYDLSLAMGERRLFKEVRAEPSETEIVVCGVSCRQQIEHGTGRRPKHLVEVLAEALD